MPKSYRIRTEIGQDKYVNVKLEQDFEQLEILSLKINESDIYTRVCSDYGVVVGRVLVNGGFGIPNAKVSVFVPLTQEDETNPIISELYPYKTLSDLNEEGYRYNLLPKDPSYSVHAVTGTFPTRQEVLLDQSYIEVYDKYYKYSVKTNDSGDFMIFGVPTGTQTLVMDVDLSDIGCFSLAPQDLIDAGVANPSQVNGNRFKSSTNLSELPQIKTLNKVIEISPFWGDVDICQFGITRVDFDLTAEANIKIEPTAVFMGSIMSTSDDDALKTNCKPKNNTGNLCELVAGPGQILAIRQTIFPDQNNLPILEEYQFEQNGKVIDGDGSFLVNVPMNIDYVITNEFGQQVISNDPKKGIPTKGRYRFKFKWENEQGLQNEFLRANFLVPNIKEHGWVSSNTDPFNPNSATLFPITLPVGIISGSTSVPGTGGIIFDGSVNSSNLTVLINNQPYYGDITSIPVSAGNTIQVVSNPTDNTQPQTINFKFLPQGYFDVLKSYAFSLDWDDYNDKQIAINCEDTFYEFNYNKVYTTAMFLDRYKNGLGRARHLGIKEIDNRSCKTTVNTFPVNDAIRNFDFIFFVFNILINILSFPILVLLFVAHLISFIWPILKYVLIIFGIYLTYDAGVAAVQALQTSAQSINAAAGIFSANIGGPIINTGWFLEWIRLIAYAVYLSAVAIFKVALALTFTSFAVAVALKVKGFPRIGLPMISYPECNNCDCECGNAEMDDNFDSNTIQSQIDSNQQGSNNTLANSNSFLAPINISQTYNLVNHPNLENRPLFEQDDDNRGYFYESSTAWDYNLESLINRLVEKQITNDVVANASVDFRRMFSGWEDTDLNNFNKFKAPQPFLFWGDKVSGSNDDPRIFGRPKAESYPQKLNEFNTRDNFFSGVNEITTTINPLLSNPSFKDNVIVLLSKQGTTSQMGVGNIITFQDPNKSNGNINLTGATTNQFGLNSITGTSISSQTTLPIQIQHSTGISTISITQTGLTENYMQYLPDIEYFQVLTGMSVSNFLTQSDTSTSFFPKDYLKHIISYDTVDKNNNIQTPPQTITTTDANGNSISLDTNNFVALEMIENYDTEYEVIILVRGVDPYTEKQIIKYDLSKIFGHTTPNTITIQGSYYLNIPIQSGLITPKTHNTPNNTISTGVYFPSYTFTPSNSYSAFTSINPYYYLSTDDTTLNIYSNGGSTYKSIPTATLTIGSYGNPNTTSNQSLQLYRNQSNFIGGGSFIGLEQYVDTTIIGAYRSNCWTDTQVGYPKYESNISNCTTTSEIVYTLYSAAYYKYTNSGELTGVNFSDSNNIVMRSDRLPTSSCIEDGPGPRTGYALHQNNNFCYYTADGATSNPTQGIAGALPSGESFDNDLGGLTQTLSCDGMVSLECYQGTGTGVTVNQNCSVPTNRVVNGCFCLLNKKYLAEYGSDAKLFLEWKARFTITFAACRGVFAQTFQNNWVNGVLYMFSFNKTAIYPINNVSNPTYTYCDDVILFNDINNGFYYRSSPWDGNNFIGKNSPTPPSSWPAKLINDYPGLGYNKKQIQFPTTITDLGPRESFISEICNNSNFNSYFVDRVKSTSYQDLSDIIQVGFLSRMLNENFRKSVLPISNPAGDNTEGKGIIQFFNSDRKGDRIDGDFAQMFSINSEWRVSPFISENYPNPNSIYFGSDLQSQPSAVFGVFFESPQIDFSSRRNLSPGFETINFAPLLQNYYGYPKTQDVPHYRWDITDGANSIFGSENNNWYTDVLSSGGFYTKGYQDLDFYTPNEYFQANPTPTGFLTNFTPIGDPEPARDTTGNYVVGAPYHFYFGLNNGKTAIDKFVKLYITTEG